MIKSMNGGNELHPKFQKDMPAIERERLDVKSMSRERVGTHSVHTDSNNCPDIHYLVLLATRDS